MPRSTIVSSPADACRCRDQWRSFRGPRPSQNRDRADTGRSPIRPSLAGRIRRSCDRPYRAPHPCASRIRRGLDPCDRVAARPVHDLRTVVDTGARPSSALSISAHRGSSRCSSTPRRSRLVRQRCIPRRVGLATVVFVRVADDGYVEYSLVGGPEACSSVDARGTAARSVGARFSGVCASSVSRSVFVAGDLEAVRREVVADRRPRTPSSPSPCACRRGSCRPGCRCPRSSRRAE